MTDPSPTPVEIEALVAELENLFVTTKDELALVARTVAAIRSLQGELAATQLHLSAWEDSARINKHRADEAEAELAALRANFDAELNEMSQRFRAVNIKRVIEQSGTDFVDLAARLQSAEAELAAMKKGRDEAREAASK